MAGFVVVSTIASQFAALNPIAQFETTNPVKYVRNWSFCGCTIVAMCDLYVVAASI